MKIFNYGSLNIDYTRTILSGGETMSSEKCMCFRGQRLNQSIALSKSGAEVWHGEPSAPGTRFSHPPVKGNRGE